jgi:hypothetical protein
MINVVHERMKGGINDELCCSIRKQNIKDYPGTHKEKQLRRAITNSVFNAE